MNTNHSAHVYHNMSMSPEEESRQQTQIEGNAIALENGPDISDLLQSTEDTAPSDNNNMVVDHEDIYTDDLISNPTTQSNPIAASDIETAALAAISTASAFQRRTVRPSYKLSVKLIDTYKNINKIYYENKAKRLREKQAAEVVAGSSSSSSAVNNRTGVNNDGYDDSNFNLILPEGPGSEPFGNRYIFQYKIGSGSFGQVVCAKDQYSNEEVAIKIIKSKRPFLIQAQTEIELLKLVKNRQVDEDGNEADFNCITLEDTFMHHNHQCLVFEMLSYNLYDLLRNSKFRGVSFGLVRKFGKQILIALEFLARPDVDIVHCDLKPENILLRHPKRSAIKIIDFGSSCRRSSRPYTYIQSRFYRSPEVLLCLGYDQKIDIWSLGCVLVEMHTGEPLFGGKDQLDQLFRIVTVLGMPPLHMIERSAEATRSIFFEKVPVSSRANTLPEFPAECDPMKKILNSDRTAFFVMKKPKSFSTLPQTRTLETVLGVYTGGPGGRRAGEAAHDVEHYLEFIDLIRKLLRYDPAERFSSTEALDHSFFAPLAIPTTSSSSGAGSPRHPPHPVARADPQSLSSERPAFPNITSSQDINSRNGDIIPTNLALGSEAISKVDSDGGSASSNGGSGSGGLEDESNMFGKRPVRDATSRSGDASPRVRSRSAPSSSSHIMRLRSSQENV